MPTKVAAGFLKHLVLASVAPLIFLMQPVHIQPSYYDLHQELLH